MTTRRTVLEVLTRPRLVEVGRTIGIDLAMTSPRPDAINALSRSSSVPLREILERLSRDELKLACQRIGVATGGKEKAQIAARILAAERRDGHTKSAAVAGNGSTTRAAAQSRGTTQFLEGVATMEDPRVRPAVSTSDRNGEQPPAGSQASPQPKKLELVWEGKRTEVNRVALPFQRIELVNESRATREAEKDTLLRVMKGGAPAVAHDAWRNKLVWGDNKYVLGSLIDEFAGKVDLIYIDPPFGTGQDFSLQVEVGDQEFVKEASLIEEKAYRDTWGRGLDSYLQMMFERFVLMRELLSAKGSIFVHADYHVSHAIKLLMDEIFGAANFRSELIVKRRILKNLQRQFESIQALPWGHDQIFWYSKSPATRYRPVLVPYETQKEEGYWHHFWSNADRPTMRYDLLGVKPERGQWKWSKDRALVAVENYKRHLRETKGRSLAQYWEDTGKEFEFIRLSKTGKVENWFPPSTERIANTLWTDVHAYENEKDYATQKHTDLLQRIVTAASEEGDLVGDFFAGSGTTQIAAESLNRRWVGCDLSRWAIQVTRKRLLDIESCRPFEVLNLGKYERQYWQGVTFGDGRTGAGKALHEYVKFILDLYRAEPVTGLVHVHGQRGGRMVHVGAADAPVTLAEVRDALEECRKVQQSKLDVLGWEWEMGLHDVIEAESKKSDVQLRLLHIPREAMDKRAVDAGDVHFYELAHLEVESETKGKSARLRLKNFVIPSPELIPDEVRNKIRKWSDYIDYWSIDFEFNDDVFHNQWQDYRTRAKRELALVSDWHDYAKPGRYKVLVKVFDIFGNDTTQLLEVRV